MKPEFAALRREQIDAQLAPLRRAHLSRPTRGWVRAIREALGINGLQLAGQLKIARSHLSQIEAAEANGTISMGTLKKAAAALDCDLAYALVPRNGKTLEELVQSRAQQVAERMVNNVAGTMALEDQAVSRRFRKREIDKRAAELVRTLSKDLWEE